MPITQEAAIAELLRRGISPDEIAKNVDPQTAQRVRSGFVSAPVPAPDAMASRQVYVDQSKRLNEQRDSLAAHQSNMGTLARFEALNRETSTGMSRNLHPFETLTEMMSPNTKEMSGIASGLQGQARPVGSGATSDFEQRLYRQGVPSPEKKRETNQSIINYQRGVMQEERDRLAFMEAYLARNQNVSGATEAWANYTAKNPYTLPGQGGQTVPNPNRTDWKAHFGLAAAPQAAPSQAAQRPAMPLNDLGALLVGSMPGGVPRKAAPAGQWRIVR